MFSMICDGQAATQNNKTEGKLEVGEAIQGRSECVVRSYFFWYCVSLLLILYAYMVTTKMKMMTL